MLQSQLPAGGCGLHRGASSDLIGAMSEKITSSQAFQPDVAQTEAGHVHLPDSWQDWITTNVLRGCTPDDMVKIMVENGFDPVFARHAVSIISGIGSRLQGMSDGERQAALDQASATRYKASPIRLCSQLPRFTVADREVELQAVMTNPNIAVIRGFLSDEECDEVVRLSRGKMKASQVVDRESGGSYQSSVRTSEGSHFDRGENELVRRIEARIQALVDIPVNRGEPLQVLHYGPGGQYKAHQDFFEPKDAGTSVLTRIGGQRIGTLVMYLNDVPEGGETAFPDIGFSAKPHKGSAVYFEYMNDAGELDYRLLHAGMPVIQGDKWIMTKWLRERPYQQ